MAYSKIVLEQEPGVEIPRNDKHGIKVEEPTLEPDVDVYEETDECDLENSGETIWLVKLPQFIQDRWDHIPSDSEAEIDLGTVLINKNDPNMIKVILSNDHGLNEGLPREYDLKTHPKPEVSNTFVFTERDDRKRKCLGAEEGFPGIPRRPFRKNDERADKKCKLEEKCQEKDEKKIFVKTPHHPTAVVGAVVAGLQMQPVLNDEYSKFEHTLQVTAKRKKSVKLFEHIIKDNILNPGTTGVVNSKQFLKIPLSGKSRVRTLDKAYRISKEGLQTKLFGLFEKYEYYTMKDLIERLCQPQAYLQEVLEEIGTYNTHGSFYGKWCLRSEYKQAMGKNETYIKIEK